MQLISIDRIKSFFTKGDKRSLIVKRNIVASLFIKGISVVVQFLMVPLTLGYLDKEIYGIWLTASSILTWFGFFDVGFTLGLRNRLTEALAHKDYARGKQLVSTTYGMMCIIFIPCGILACSLTPYLNWSTFFNIADSYNEQLVKVMLVLFSSFVLQMILGTISSVATAFQKTALASSYHVIGNVIALVVIWILTKLTTGSMLYLALSISFIPAIVTLVGSFLLYRTSDGAKVSPDFRYFCKDKIKDLFSLGAKFFIIQLQLIVLYQSANILISNVSSPDDVTNYNIAYRYIFCGAMIFQIFLTPYWPAFTDAYAKGDFPWMRNSYRNLTKVYISMCIGVVAMVAISPIVYSLWIGQSDAVPWNMTISVAVFTILNAWVQIQTYLINGIGDIKLQTIVTSVGLVLQIPLSLFLGKICNFGSIGVVMSMSILNLLYCAVFTWQLRRLLRM